MNIAILLELDLFQVSIYSAAACTKNACLFLSCYTNFTCTILLFAAI